MAKPKALKLRDAATVRAFTNDQTIERWAANAATKAVNASDVDATITIYDVIGQDYWTGDGVTLKGIDDQLKAIGEKDVTVAINSPGGDMMEGVGIFNRLLAHPGKVTVKVMGYAASAASVIAMAGDDIQMGDGAFIMIHNAWVIALGNKEELRGVADWLEPFDAAMVGVYAAKTGLSADEVSALMVAETWLSADEAIEQGFADGRMNKADQGSRALAAQPEVPAVRSLEKALTSGDDLSRSSAQSLINAFKTELEATRDASPDATRDAGDPDADISALTAGLLATIKGVTHA